MTRAVLLLALAGCASPGGSSGDGFTSLFDGRTLDAWNAAPGSNWVVEDGTIALKGKTDGQEHNGAYLWTKDAYGDFILELEFRIPERANSGIFFRTSDLSDPVYTGLEVQVANSHGRTELSRTGTAGAVYDLQAPSKNAVKPPGEWNRLRLECRGPRVTVVLNGEQVVDMDLDRWTEPNRNPDGSKNKFPRAARDFARRGYIGLQDHGRPVWYRAVRIRPL
ncbi:MAG TPA: DUF1080 domain-containing protein [Planctomycetota bacterium]|nr:DUF1080 domain-containing protein [Planctomycetota bacterium]